MSEVKPMTVQEAHELVCPICGYYCVGKGGYGCIDKLGMYEACTRATIAAAKQQEQK